MTQYENYTYMGMYCSCSLHPHPPPVLLLPEAVGQHSEEEPVKHLLETTVI